MVKLDVNEFIAEIMKSKVNMGQLSGKAIKASGRFWFGQKWVKRQDKMLQLALKDCFPRSV